MRRLTTAPIAFVRVAALAALLALDHAAFAQPDAPAHFQRALDLYQEQDFAGALVEFRRAYEIAPTYKLFYNIGQVCYQLTDYACALDNFELYLKEGGGSISTERRVEVERELAKLRLRIGHLEIVTNVPGVEITIDDVAVGRTPLATSVVVSAGKRRIVGTREGYAPVSRVVEVAGTDSSRVELVFTNASSGEAPLEVRHEPRWNTLSWIGLGTAAALGAAGGVTGALALDASNDLEKETFADGRGPTDEMRSLKRRADTLSIVSDVTLGLSAATLLGTLIYSVAHKPKVIESTTPTGKNKTTTSSLSFDITGAGGVLKGRF